jgi:hypothetical protein
MGSGGGFTGWGENGPVFGDASSVFGGGPGLTDMGAGGNFTGWGDNGPVFGDAFTPGDINSMDAMGGIGSWGILGGPTISDYAADPFGLSTGGVFNGLPGLVPDGMGGYTYDMQADPTATPEQKLTDLINRMIADQTAGQNAIASTGMFNFGNNPGNPLAPGYNNGVGEAGLSRMIGVLNGLGANIPAGVSDVGPGEGTIGDPMASPGPKAPPATEDSPFSVPGEPGITPPKDFNWEGVAPTTTAENSALTDPNQVSVTPEMLKAAAVPSQAAMLDPRTLSDIVKETEAAFQAEAIRNPFIPGTPEAQQWAQEKIARMQESIEGPRYPSDPKQFVPMRDIPVGMVTPFNDPGETVKDAMPPGVMPATLSNINAQIAALKIAQIAQQAWGDTTQSTNPFQQNMFANPAATTPYPVANVSDYQANPYGIVDPSQVELQPSDPTPSFTTKRWGDILNEQTGVTPNLGSIANPYSGVQPGISAPDPNAIPHDIPDLGTAPDAVGGYPSKALAPATGYPSSDPAAKEQYYRDLGIPMQMGVGDLSTPTGTIGTTISVGANPSLADPGSAWGPNAQASAIAANLAANVPGTLTGTPYTTSVSVTPPGPLKPAPFSMGLPRDPFPSSDNALTAQNFIAQTIASPAWPSGPPDVSGAPPISTGEMPQIPEPGPVQFTDKTNIPADEAEIAKTQQVINEIQRILGTPARVTMPGPMTPGGYPTGASPTDASTAATGNFGPGAPADAVASRYATVPTPVSTTAMGGPYPGVDQYGSTPFQTASTPYSPTDRLGPVASLGPPEGMAPSGNPPTGIGPAPGLPTPSVISGPVDVNRWSAGYMPASPYLSTPQNLTPQMQNWAGNLPSNLPDQIGGTSAPPGVASNTSVPAGPVDVNRWSAGYTPASPYLSTPQNLSPQMAPGGFGTQYGQPFPSQPQKPYDPLSSIQGPYTFAAPNLPYDPLSSIQAQTYAPFTPTTFPDANFEVQQRPIFGPPEPPGMPPTGTMPPTTPETTQLVTPTVNTGPSGTAPPGTTPPTAPSPPGQSTTAGNDETTPAEGQMPPGKIGPAPIPPVWQQPESSSSQVYLGDQGYQGMLGRGGGGAASGGPVLPPPATYAAPPAPLPISGNPANGQLILPIWGPGLGVGHQWGIDPVLDWGLYKTPESQNTLNFYNWATRTNMGQPFDFTKTYL